MFRYDCAFIILSYQMFNAKLVKNRLWSCQVLGLAEIPQGSSWALARSLLSPLAFPLPMVPFPQMGQGLAEHAWLPPK